jgi:hypothetical protein
MKNPVARMKSPFDGVDPALCPRDPNTGEPLPPRTQPGYYPGFSTLSQSPFWDEATRKVVDKRVKHPPERKFFSAEAWSFWTAVFAHLIPQTDRTADRQIPIVAVLDHRLATGQTVGYRYESMPPDRVVYEIGIEAIDLEAEHRYGGKFLVLPYAERDEVLKAIHDGRPEAAREIWKRMSVHRFWQMIMGDAIDAYYAHPWAWDEVGFGGPAYPRAYTRLERGEPEPWEVEEQRYEWLAPASTASAEVDSSQSHHTESGQHSLLDRQSKAAKQGAKR